MVSRWANPIIFLHLRTNLQMHPETQKHYFNIKTLGQNFKILLRMPKHVIELLNKIGSLFQFNAVFLWPGLILLHVTQKETFELPSSRQWEFLIVNGIIGTVVSELLWLWGCFLTSSLVSNCLENLFVSLVLPPNPLCACKKGHTVGI